MKRVQVLGTGCPKCQHLARNAEQAMRDAQIEGEVEKITDLTEIMEFGVMVTPALLTARHVKRKVWSPPRWRSMAK